VRINLEWDDGRDILGDAGRNERVLGGRVVSNSATDGQSDGQQQRSTRTVLVHRHHRLHGTRCRTERILELVVVHHQRVCTRTVTTWGVWMKTEVSIAVRESQPASGRRELTCHTHRITHSVTCHLTEVTFPTLPQPIKAGTRLRGPIESWKTGSI